MAHPAFRILFALFLIAHGLVNVVMAMVPVAKPGEARTPYYPSWWRTDVDEKWPISRMGLKPEIVRPVGVALWVSAAGLFVLAGIGLLGMPFLVKLWQPLALTAAIISVVLLGLVWHRDEIFGLLLNIGVGAGVLTHLFDKWFG
jgi:hypothetical protein